jgi:NAD-dependent dihydropyrimidine dehydrogenase PreA subunit
MTKENDVWFERDICGECLEAHEKCPSDLFEIIETLPLDIQNLLGQFEREGYDYQTCAKYLAILESKGYTFEYSLDGTPFNLTETK